MGTHNSPLEHWQATDGKVREWELHRNVRQAFILVRQSEIPSPKSKLDSNQKLRLSDDERNGGVQRYDERPA